MRTSDLTGAALDWAVEEALGGDHTYRPREYSTDWSQGGPIIEREIKRGMRLQKDFACYFILGVDRFAHLMSGPDILIAAMRCYVASKLGDEVEIPEELL